MIQATCGVSIFLLPVKRPLEGTMSAKRLFAVLLTAGILLATGAIVATVAIGPTLAGPSGGSCTNNVK
jgi:hypothetical protein